jgi:uncharacterized membrane protein
MVEHDSTLTGRIGRHIRRRLVSGLLVLVPLAITVVVVKLLFSSLTAFILPLLEPLRQELPAYALPVIALAATVLIVYIVGVVTTHIVGRRLIHLGESILLRLPIVKPIYAASKQAVDVFSAKNNAGFKAVVLVEFPRAGSLAVGFVTGTIRDPQGRAMSRVFIPTTPNPTSGFLLILPENQVQFTTISVEDGIKMIVSGGMLAPETYGIAPRREDAETAPEA